MKNATFRIWRGDANGGKFEQYTIDIAEGMVVLDAVHQVQAQQANAAPVLQRSMAGPSSCA
jgi:succinate dehydrogenase / fumarate reductase iron-sulfur subunit